MRDKEVVDRIKDGAISMIEAYSNKRIESLTKIVFKFYDGEVVFEMNNKKLVFHTSNERSKKVTEELLYKKHPFTFPRRDIDKREGSIGAREEPMLKITDLYQLYDKKTTFQGWYEPDDMRRCKVIWEGINNKGETVTGEA